MAGQAAPGQDDTGQLSDGAPNRAGRGRAAAQRPPPATTLALHQHPLGLLDQDAMLERPLQLLGQLPLHGGGRGGRNKLASTPA
jgi:hypothetical protein